MVQLELAKTAGWGGRRKGAGRKRRTRLQSHVQRPVHKESYPLHVTLRAIGHGLRKARVREQFNGALVRLRKRREDFRVLQYSLQDNHLHMIVEASDKETLSRGMQGFASALGRVINRALGRKGALWADRYHARELKSPPEVRNALVYVLRNAAKHLGRAEDEFSSAKWFDGFRDAAPAGNSPLGHARTWLVTLGWRRRGLIGPKERPKEEIRIVVWDYVEAISSAEHL